MAEKSQEEIIEELKSKGKYDEWVSLGSYFGLTSNVLDVKFFLIRPYKYYNVDENIINVSMIQKTYRQDVDNIAVFKQILIKDPTYVEQSEYRIVNISETLTTAGLATCSGLTMIIGNKKFLTHLDALTDINPMVINLIKILSEQSLTPNNITNIKIYTGSLDSSLTKQKSIEICSQLGIEESRIEILQVCMFDIISI